MSTDSNVPTSGDSSTINTTATTTTTATIIINTATAAASTAAKPAAAVDAKEVDQVEARVAQLTTEATADSTNETGTFATADFPAPNHMDLHVITEQFREAIRPLESIVQQHGARMTPTEYTATCDIISDMHKSHDQLVEALGIHDNDDNAEKAKPIMPSQHLRNTQAESFGRLVRVTSLCADVYRATKQFEIVNSARKAFALRVEAQNRALADSFGLDLDQIKTAAAAADQDTNTNPTGDTSAVDALQSHI